MQKTAEEFIEELLDFIVYEKSFRYIQDNRCSDPVVKVQDVLNKAKEFQEQNIKDKS